MTYKIEINVNSNQPESEKYLLICAITDYLKAKLDKEFMDTPFNNYNIKYDISFSRKV